MTQMKSQLEQAYTDLSDLQFSADQEKVQLEVQVQQVEEQLKVGARHSSATCVIWVKYNHNFINNFSKI